MQIVIDIPEEKYQGIINRAEEILDEAMTIIEADSEVEK